jgi:hypothetical protein
MHRGTRALEEGIQAYFELNNKKLHFRMEENCR